MSIRPSNLPVQKSTLKFEFKPNSTANFTPNKDNFLTILVENLSLHI
jgi:flagellar hook assembly protein FlgD